ncbi:nucleotidyltransferase [Candidatus Woesearchaeota archaeon CG_4_10_14_0_2_um_filter_33_10]|nr:MAG: nucleotidyltransferase [Candidatus Woesearchaeota archaeon CG10_big_fil_rev_8_21_14_0_10_33_12]PIZ53223.1 MAG: nucleotidyltransferase [Candidatus Woesearchaeota archaeon CG_4_10_14_0_2_um_filter_33_10]
MKVIIPLAGKGTRLRPHTFSKPKPLLRVAGKAVLGHIIDKLKPLDVEEIIFITGDMQEKIKEYVNSNYKYKARYIKQDELLGDGYAINLAKEYVKEDVLIVFVDTIFETDLSKIKNVKSDGVVWVQEVDDPRRFGVVVLKNDHIEKIIEKSDEPISNLAIIGLYYIKNSSLMFHCLDEIIKCKLKSKGEFRLADALGLMIKNGARLNALEVDQWLDCGKPETLLSTNRYLLKNGFNKEIKTTNSVIIGPVYIEDKVKIENSIIGPNASIASGCVIKNSIVKDSIVGENAVIENAALNKSLVGDDALIKDAFKKINVGDNSEIDFE